MSGLVRHRKRYGSPVFPEIMNAVDSTAILDALLGRNVNASLRSNAAVTICRSWDLDVGA